MHNTLLIAFLVALSFFATGCKPSHPSNGQGSLQRPANTCEYGSCQEPAKWDVRWTTMERMDEAARNGRSITTNEWSERRCDMHQQDGNSIEHVLRGARYRG